MKISDLFFFVMNEGTKYDFTILLDMFGFRNIPLYVYVSLFFGLFVQIERANWVFGYGESCPNRKLISCVIFERKFEDEKILTYRKAHKKVV